MTVSSAPPTHVRPIRYLSHAPADLADWFAPVIRNYRGIATGRILSSVVLDKSSADISRRVAGPQ